MTSMPRHLEHTKVDFLVDLEAARLLLLGSGLNRGVPAGLCFGFLLGCSFALQVIHNHGRFRYQSVQASLGER